MTEPELHAVLDHAKAALVAWHSAHTLLDDVAKECPGTVGAGVAAAQAEVGAAALSLLEIILRLSRELDVELPAYVPVVGSQAN